MSTAPAVGRSRPQPGWRRVRFTATHTHSPVGQPRGRAHHQRRAGFLQILDAADLDPEPREPVGLDRMKQALWEVAPSGDFSFRDLFADQEVIFAESVNTAPLRTHLLRHFAGRAVSIQGIIDHVIVATPYASNHVKKLTLAGMQKDGLIATPISKTEHLPKRDHRRIPGRLGGSGYRAVHANQ
jgi:hypothetical protein